MNQLSRSRWAVVILGTSLVAFAFASPAMAQRHGGHRGGHHGGHHGGHSGFGIHIGGVGGHYGGHYGGHHGHHYDHHYDWPYVVGGIVGGAVESRYYYSQPEYYYEDDSVRRVPAPPRYSGAPIKISNPKGSGGDLTYHLNQWTYTIKPGESQTIKHDRNWIIRFDRGGKHVSAEYSLKGGAYSLKQTSGGWELFNATEKKDAPPALPAPPAPPKSP